jgi:hypothetical protein
MNITANFEPRAGSSQSKHEGEPSFALCDRLSRIRDNSQRQLPTDHDYAVPTREYQTDQSSLNLPRLLLALSSRKSNYKDTRRLRRVDTVTPYQGNSLIHLGRYVSGMAVHVGQPRTNHKRGFQIFK